MSIAAGLALFLSALPALAAPPAKAFGELPVAYDGAISPDGTHLGVIINVKGTYAVYVKNLGNETAQPMVLSMGDNWNPQYLKWVNDNRFVVSVTQSQKYRGTPFTVGYLVVSDITSRETKLLVSSRKIFRQFNNRVIDWLEDDPDHILMAYSDNEWDPYPDIRKVNVNTRRDKLMKRGKTGIEYWKTDQDGTPRVGTGQDERGNERRVIYNTATERWDSVDKYPGLDADIPIYGILKNGTELLIPDYQGKNTRGLYIYNLNQKRVTRTVFHNENFDASGAVLSKDGETVIGAKYTADRDKVELIGEYGTLLDRLRGEHPEYDVSYVDQTEDGDTVLVTLSAPSDPGGLYMYSVNGGLNRITPMYNGLESDELGGTAAVKYPARDGNKIPAFVTLPPGVTSPKNLPFIVLPHGGPYARDSNRFDYLAQFFATRGYGVLQMNFRGSEGYGKDFSDAGRNNWVVMQNDVEDGTRWLYEKGYADRSRTCIAGWSYGGYAALMGVANDPDLYKCAVAMAALTDIKGAKRSMREYRGGKYAADEFFGEAMDDKDTMRANSPIHVAGNIKVPVFLAHGTMDENVQFDQFTRMQKVMKKAGVKGTYMTFKDEDHYLRTQKYREDFFVGIEKFLNKVNGPSEYMAK